MTKSCQKYFEGQKIIIWQNWETKNLINLLFIDLVQPTWSIQYPLITTRKMSFYDIGLMSVNKKPS